jgi:hypothetical protein
VSQLVSTDEPVPVSIKHPGRFVMKRAMSA